MFTATERHRWPLNRNRNHGDGVDRQEAQRNPQWLLSQRGSQGQQVGGYESENTIAEKEYKFLYRNLKCVDRYEFSVTFTD